MVNDEIIKLLSAVGVGAIITAIVTFLQSSKKNQLDYITKERSEWRRQLKEILVELSIEESREQALVKLKSQINPYGKNRDLKNTKPYFMREGHIWDLLALPSENIDSDKLSFYIHLLLKYDWERSKQEIRFKPSLLLDVTIKMILLLANIYFGYIYSSNIILFFLAIVSFFLLIAQNMVTNVLFKNPSKNNNEKIWVFVIFYVVPYIFIAYSLIQKLKLGFESTFPLFLIGLIGYEIYFLSKFSSIDDDYIYELERIFTKKSIIDNEVTKLNNLINTTENKVYKFQNDESTLKSLKKKHRKLKKKLTKKKRPKEILLHPILYFKYLKNRRRISKIVKKIELKRRN